MEVGGRLLLLNAVILGVSLDRINYWESFDCIGVVGSRR